MRMFGERFPSMRQRKFTSLEDRGRASRDRAAASEMMDAQNEQIAAEAAVMLSIVPPAEAIGLAERLAASPAKTERQALSVNCNASSVSSVNRIGKIMESAGVCFIGGGIIGGPPEGDQSGPVKCRSVTCGRCGKIVSIPFG